MVKNLDLPLDMVEGLVLRVGDALEQIDAWLGNVERDVWTADEVRDRLLDLRQALTS